MVSERALHISPPVVFPLYASLTTRRSVAQVSFRGLPGDFFFPYDSGSFTIEVETFRDRFRLVSIDETLNFASEKARICPFPVLVSWRPSSTLNSSAHHWNESIDLSRVFKNLILAFYFLYFAQLYCFGQFFSHYSRSEHDWLPSDAMGV